MTINFEAAIGSHFVSAEKSLITMVPGGQLVLPYHFSGSPRPIAKWSHLNTTNLIEPSKYNDSHLTLRNVSQSDAGIFRVVVSNSGGKAKALFSLSVQGMCSVYL